MSESLANKPILLYVIKFTLIGGAQLHLLQLMRHFRKTYDVHLCVGQMDHIAHVAQQDGFVVHHLPIMERDATIPVFIRMIQDLRFLLRRVSPGLVHVHSPLAGVACRIACWKENVPCLTTIHSWNFAPGMPWTRRVSSWVLEFLVAKLGQPIITVSDYDLRLGQQYRVAGPPQVEVIHNGIPDLRSAGPVEHTEPVKIVMVARFDVRKCQDQLLRAIAKVPGQWRVIFAGDGPSREQNEELAKSLDIAHRVEFLGNVHDVPKLLAACDMAVLVSQAEGLPLAILEALRAGLPVIASDVGGVREAVLDGQTGYLIPMDDVALLHKKLDALVADPKLRQQFGRAGRDHFLQQFLESAMLARTSRTYHALMR